MNSRKILSALAAPIALVGLSACESFPIKLTTPAVFKASIDFKRSGDLQFARDASPAQIKTAEGFLASDPENDVLLGVVASGYVEYTFGFIEDDLESTPDDPQHQAERERLTKRATYLYDHALELAMRRIALEDKNFAAAFKKDVSTLEAELKKLDKDALPGIYFGALALASGININRTDMARVVDLPKATAMMKRAYALDPNYADGGPAMSLGIITGSQGRAMGGDPDASKKYFEQSLAATSGKHLLTKVMMARFYAVVVQDRALFEKLLKEVLDTPADIDPARRLPNEVAKKRAARYLAHVEDYF